MENLAEVKYLSELSLLLEPISNTSPTGSDPRYDDKFLKLKFEMERSGNIDFAKLEQLASSILRYTAKDLRVVGCLMLAVTHQHGLNGLCSVMHLIAHLLQGFWEDIYPRSQAGRVSALEYLGHPRMQAAISQIKPKTQAQLNALEKAYNHLQQSLYETIGEKADNILSQAFKGVVLSNAKSNSPYQNQSNHAEHKPVEVENLHTNNTINWEKLITPKQTTNSIPNFFSSKEYSINSRQKVTTNTQLNQNKTQNFSTNNNVNNFKVPKSLQAEIEQILSVPTSSQKEQFTQTLLIAEMCVVHGIFELAIDCFEVLDYKIEYYKLIEWEPDFALRVYRAFYDLINNSPNLKSNLSLGYIRQKLIQLDVAVLLED